MANLPSIFIPVIGVTPMVDDPTKKSEEVVKTLVLRSSALECSQVPLTYQC